MEQQYFSLSSFLLNVLIFLSLLIVTIFLLRKKRKSDNPRAKLPPGPLKLPFIGNLLFFVGTFPHRCLRDLAQKYGSVMHLQLGQLSTIVISSAEAAKQVMQTHDLNFATRPYTLAISILTYNFIDIAFAPYGDHWRQMKKICTLELLSSNRVQSFRSIREEEVAAFITEISSRAGSPIDLRQRFWSLTYGIISRAAFGVKYKDQDDFTILAQESSKAWSGFNFSDVFPSLKLLHVISGATSKLKKLHQDMDAILQIIIEQHKARKGTHTIASCKKEADDLVDVLLYLQDHGNLDIPLTDSTIKAVIMDIFIGGGETATTVIEWAFCEMLKSPRILAKAQREVRQVFGSKGDVNEERLENLKYLKLVVKEALRLHPPAPLLAPRESRERCEINGYDIPAKTKVLVNAWAIGRDPNHWFEAEEFYPERFLNNSIDYKGAHFELIPFGAGRRICPGMSFGMSNVELTLAYLLYHFDWKFQDGRKFEDIDMAEAFALTVTRKHDLCLVPIPYNP